MTPDMSEKLKRSLTLHEGRRNYPYTDTVGKVTIGIGYNLTDRGVSDAWIDSTFSTDINYFDYLLSTTFTWFPSLNQDRQIALIDMCFMGFKRFMEFHDMISCFEKGDMQGAHDAMLDSEWAKQVPDRANNLAHVILTGVYDI